VISLSELTIGELAAFIAEHLHSKGIETVLVGGACISIYSFNDHLHQAFRLPQPRPRFNLDEGLFRVMQSGEGREALLP
jgi:hypothetical protein